MSWWISQGKSVLAGEIHCDRLCDRRCSRTLSEQEPVLKEIAVIFDMDDTLARTSPQWRVAETALLAALGRSWDVTLAQQYKGMNALDVAATIHRLLEPAMSREDCQTLMRDHLIQAFQEQPPAEMPGAAACVKGLQSHHRLAVASGSPMRLIRQTISHLGVAGAFEVVLTSESVARGKPHPDVFLATAAAMKVDPERCVVMEDSVIGVQAALAAGMKCIAIPSSDPSPFHAIAHRVVTSLEEVDVKFVARVAGE